MKHLKIYLGAFILAGLTACNSGGGSPPTSPPPSSMEIRVGSTLQRGFSRGGSVCKTDINSPDATITVVSSNNSVATVNPNTCQFTLLYLSSCCNFDVTAIESGSVTITATANGYNPASATIAIFN